jgi:hypothetical protein
MKPASAADVEHALVAAQADQVEQRLARAELPDLAAPEHRQPHESAPDCRTETETELGVKDDVRRRGAEEREDDARRVDAVFARLCHRAANNFGTTCGKLPTSSTLWRSQACNMSAFVRRMSRLSGPITRPVPPTSIRTT